MSLVLGSHLQLSRFSKYWSSCCVCKNTTEQFMKVRSAIQRNTELYSS